MGGQGKRVGSQIVRHGLTHGPHIQIFLAQFEHLLLTGYMTRAGSPGRQ